MDNIDLSHLDKRLQYELEKVGLLSCRRLLEIDENELQKLCNFSLPEVESIKTTAANNILPIGFKTVKGCELIYRNKWRKLSFDCSSIDAVLDGGIPLRGITELSGESGVGKTQICLQLAITVQYPIDCGGLSASAIYICTEDKFPSIRLQQMIQNFPRNEQCKSQMKNHNFADNVFIDHIGDLDGLRNCLFKRLPLFLKNSKLKIGLIIIDSIAAIYRSEFALNELVSRAHDMRLVGLQLHKLIDAYNLAVVCINQVTDVCENGITIPALGLAWANLVTTKLFVKNNSETKVRTLHITHAPHLPSRTASFIITENGVEPLL